MRVILIFLVLLLAGCSTTTSNIKSLPTINNPSVELTDIKQKYVDELAVIQVGDYIESVASLFPEMYIASDTMKNTQYEFDYQQQYFLTADKNSLEKTYTQTLRFYFVNRKLVHWQVI
jgi:hypothetical protein